MAAVTLIDHQEAGSGGVASWTKTSIPTDGTYDHLLVKASVRAESSGYIDNVIGVNLNGDTTGNYTYIEMGATNATMYGDGVGAATPYARVGVAMGTSSDAEYFSSLELWIINCANATYFTQMTAKSVTENQSDTINQWCLTTGMAEWATTPAVHTVALSVATGGDFAEYSTFTLYGIKGI